MIKKNHRLVDLYIRTKLAERATTEDLFDGITERDTVSGAYLLYNPRTGEVYFGTTENLYDCYTRTLTSLKEGNHWEDQVREAFLRMSCESPIFIPVRTNSVMEAFAIAEALCAGYAEHPKLLNRLPKKDTSFHPVIDKENLVEMLLGQKVYPLKEVKAFEGAGICALYYTGGFEPYAAISEQNKNGQFLTPIWVAQGRVIYDRLLYFTGDINFATNLDIDDFYCRFLVIDEAWIALGKFALIEKFKPLWNKVVNGFGSIQEGGPHQARSLWDTLHPGRDWAKICRPRKETPEDIIRKVEDYLFANNSN